MCGIVAYVGNREAYPLILKGLKRLEYRGYDSSGVALLENGELNIYKKKGKVSDLEAAFSGKELKATTGIGHTRWATHGEPNDRNAHPHYSNNRKLAIIHNGIIENYAAIKKKLSDKGHVFLSDTDTEVLVHFIEDIQSETGHSLEEAVRLALREVVGAYAIVIMSVDHPEQLIAARKGSPLVIGIGENEYFFASDATPIIEYTKDVVYLDDFQIAVVRDNKLSIQNLDNLETIPYIQKLEMELETIEKGGYDHFMIKEIFEQPRSIADSMRGRLRAEEGHLSLGGLGDYLDKLAQSSRIVIVGCGTSWHAGLVAEYLFEELARIKCGGRVRLPNSDTGIRLSMKVILLLPFRSQEKRLIRLPRLNWQNLKVQLFSVFATLLARQLPGQRMPALTHMRGRRLASRAPKRLQRR